MCAEHVQQLGSESLPIQPDGGEGLAKRKGDLREGRLKEARSKNASR